MSNEAKSPTTTIREALSAMRSCIKSGEPWTEQMQQAYDKAIAALPTHIERDPFVLEQNAVWGDGPEWHDAMMRLKYDDLRLDDVAEQASSAKDPERLIVAVLDTIAPPGASGAYERVRARFETKRSAVTDNLKQAMDVGAVRHALTHEVANAVLRGVVHHKGAEAE